MDDMDDHNPEGLQDVRQAPKVDRLQNVVQVVAGQQHVAALKADGTVVADGLTSLGQTDTEECKDIVSIAVGWMQTVGVDSSGHVWFTGRDQTGQAEAVKFWDDIVAVSTGGGVDGYPGNGHTVGLKRDGTVVSTRPSKEIAEEEGIYTAACDTEWMNIRIYKEWEP